VTSSETKAKTNENEQSSEKTNLGPREAPRGLNQGPKIYNAI
jgi:hypothetical protein